MDNRLRFLSDLTKPLAVPPGSTVTLSRDHDPGYTGQVTKDQATALLADGVQLLAEYQAGSPRRTRTASCWCCRASTRRARTARSST